MDVEFFCFVKEIHTTTVCYHCGTDCEETAIKHEAKAFCCEGCKTVYDILAHNGLEKYYELEYTPGKSMKDHELSGKFDYLDDELLKTKLLDFKSDTLCKITFRLPQIHCSSCVWLLENLYKLHGGVLQSRVNFMKQRASIDFNPQHISLKTLVALLASIGYEPDVKLNDVEQKQLPIDKRLWYKLGVAGFCFGNIMFLSLPEYFSTSGYLKSFIGGLFGYLNIVLGLPVLFYSARDYFVDAWVGIKKAHLPMDVPISLGMISLFVVSLYEIITTTGTGYFDSLAGLVFFLLLGKVFQQKSFQTLSFDRNYKSYFPLSVSKITEEGECSIPLQQLQKGDAILVKNGELIPADAMLLTSNAQIDYSFVTGESAPVNLVAGEIIYAGGRLMGEAAKMEVMKEVSQSYLVELWNNEAFSKQKEYSLDRFSNKVSKSFTIIILLIAFLAGGFWLFTNVSLALKVFTSVLIVACPCALALSIPFVYGNSLRIMAHHSFYLRNVGVIDAMTNVKSLVFDKTGTLTDNTAGYVEFVGIELAEQDVSLVKSVAKLSTHPLSRKINDYLVGKTVSVDSYNEFPGKGVVAKIDDHLIVLGSGEFVHQDKKRSYKSGVHVKIDNDYLGVFLIKKTLRAGVTDLISSLRQKYALYVLSGDRETEKVSFQIEVGRDVKLYLEQSPHDKLEKIKDLQHQQQVMMLGDGLNDAGALQQSNVGVAVTDDVSIFTPASDAILLGGQLTKLDGFLRFARISKRLVIVSFIISFLYNVVGLFFAIQGMLSPVLAAVLMPLSSVSVVGFAFMSTYLFSKKCFKKS